MLKIKVVIGDTYIRQFSYNISQSFSRAASVLNGALANVKIKEAIENMKAKPRIMSLISILSSPNALCLPYTLP